MEQVFLKCIMLINTNWFWNAIRFQVELIIGCLLMNSSRGTSREDIQPEVIVFLKTWRIWTFRFEGLEKKTNEISVMPIRPQFLPVIYFEETILDAILNHSNSTSFTERRHQSNLISTKHKLSKTTATFYSPPKTKFRRSLFVFFTYQINVITLNHSNKPYKSKFSPNWLSYKSLQI